MSDLRALVEQVHRCRTDLATVRQDFNLLIRAWESEHADLLAKITGLTAATAEAERQLREAALAAYRETQSKAPCPGVGIRVITKVSWTPGAALEWAIDHRMCLKLDEKQFETLAKKGMIEGVGIEVLMEPTATISADLAKVLAETAPTT